MTLRSLEYFNVQSAPPPARWCRLAMHAAAASVLSAAIAITVVFLADRNLLPHRCSTAAIFGVAIVAFVLLPLGSLVAGVVAIRRLIAAGPALRRWVPAVLAVTVGGLHALAGALVILLMYAFRNG